MTQKPLKLFEVRFVNGTQINPTIVLAKDFDEAVLKIQRLWKGRGLRSVSEFR